MSIFQKRKNNAASSSKSIWFHSAFLISSLACLNCSLLLSFWIASKSRSIALRNTGLPTFNVARAAWTFSSKLYLCRCLGNPFCRRSISSSRSLLILFTFETLLLRLHNKRADADELCCMRFAVEVAQQKTMKLTSSQAWASRMHRKPVGWRQYMYSGHRSQLESKLYKPLLRHYQSEGAPRGP